MTATWDLVADLVDPPAVTDPERLSPCTFAENRSRGQWRRAAHLDLIEQLVLDAIATSGRVIISVSVRHGKSELCSRWIPAWYLGTHPDKRVILAGHEADFAAAHGRAAREILTEYGRDVFDVAVKGSSSAANRWDLAAPHAGGMLTVGVGGSPIGRGGDLVIVDDPFKNFEEAMSPKIRQKVKEWWTGTMVSRIEPGGAVIIICARWHEDDLSGFLLREDGDNWTEIRLPAICDAEDDPLGRELGAPLWPERYPLEVLEERKREVSLVLGDQVWGAQFQQDPKPLKGGMFPEGRWQYWDALPCPINHIRWCRGWDLAATDEGGDWTVGVLMGLTPDEQVVIHDVVRGQWAPDEVRANIRKTAAADPHGTLIELPQDPGQAGKDQALQLVRMLAGYLVNVRTVSGSKEVRAAGLSAQQRGSNVWLTSEGGDWDGTFVAELRGFPKGMHDDQVDAASTAFTGLVDPPIPDEVFEDDDEPVSISPV